MDGTGDNCILDTTFLHLYSVLIEKVMITVGKMIAVEYRSRPGHLFSFWKFQFGHK